MLAQITAANPTFKRAHDSRVVFPDNTEKEWIFMDSKKIVIKDSTNLWTKWDKLAFSNKDCYLSDISNGGDLSGEDHNFQKFISETLRSFIEKPININIGDFSFELSNDLKAYQKLISDTEWLLKKNDEKSRISPSTYKRAVEILIDALEFAGRGVLKNIPVFVRPGEDNGITIIWRFREFSAIIYVPENDKVAPPFSIINKNPKRRVLGVYERTEFEKAVNFFL